MVRFCISPNPKAGEYEYLWLQAPVKIDVTFDDDKSPKLDIGGLVMDCVRILSSIRFEINYSVTREEVTNMVEKSMAVNGIRGKVACSHDNNTEEIIMSNSLLVDLENLEVISKEEDDE